MRKMTEADRLKMEKTKNFLSLYSLAVENLKVISELEQHINENLNNPSIGGKGYLTGSGKPYLSGGAGAAVIKADSMQSYSQSQTKRNQEIMKDIENAIADNETMRAFIEYNIMMGNIEDPSEDEEEGDGEDD